MKYLLISHIIGFIACFLREAYGSKVAATGLFIKLFECGALAIYYFSICYALFDFTTYKILEGNFELILEVMDGMSALKSNKINEFEHMALEHHFPRCFDIESGGKYESFGRVEEWIMIELLVFCTFLLTLAILLIKSRFMNIGFDNSQSFD
jgi:hypothetical protein